MAKPNRKKVAFLAALAESGNVSTAARASGIGRTSHYRWLEEDSEYAGHVADAVDQAVEALEAEARKRAMASSDVLLIFLLKAARPDKYRDRKWVHHSGLPDKPQPADPSQDLTYFTDDDLHEIIRMYERAEARKREIESNNGDHGAPIPASPQNGRR